MRTTHQHHRTPGSSARHEAHPAHNEIERGIVEATTTSTPTFTNQDRWQMLGGERFYAIARWLMLLLLFAISPLLTPIPVWPITSGDLTVMLLWAYAGFAVLTTIALFIPPLSPLLNLAYLIDIAFISFLALFSGETMMLFFPLYLLPLISAAIRQQPAVSLLSGIVASFFYIMAIVGGSMDAEQTTLALDPLDYVSLGLQVLTLSFIPWLTSGLAERWTASNRRSVAAAQQQTDEALRAAQSFRDQMRSLYEVAYALSTTMNYQHVLESTLEESQKLVPYTAGLVLLSSGVADELYVAAGHGIETSDMGRRIQVAKGNIANALRSPDPRLANDISHEPDLRHIETLQTCKGACIIPLRAQLRTYGIMLIASDRSNAFNAEQLDMVNALAQYAIIALHNAQLLIDLKEERNKLISKEEEVRRQLARDLHDGPAQALAAITMNIEFIKRLLERDPQRVIEELDKLSTLSKRTTYEVRTMLFELRPLVLETQGLRVTLEQYLERFQNSENNNGTEIILETEDVDDVSLDTKTEGTLFNIIQEAINNALKHAQAEHIWVRLQSDGINLTTVVQDDGKGFDKAKVLRSYEKRGSFGLLNIDERARLVGGSADMESAPGEGTTVSIVVPLE
jgi:signal transduction histidine kinase